jgi:hypothetical protein
MLGQTLLQYSILNDTPEVAYSLVVAHLDAFLTFRQDLDPKYLSLEDGVEVHFEVQSPLGDFAEERVLSESVIKDFNQYLFSEMNAMEVLSEEKIKTRNGFLHKYKKMEILVRFERRVEKPSKAVSKKVSDLLIFQSGVEHAIAGNKDQAIAILRSLLPDFEYAALVSALLNDINLPEAVEMVFSSTLRLIKSMIGSQKLHEEIFSSDELREELELAELQIGSEEKR